MPTVTPTTETAWAELHRNIRGFIARRVGQPADVDDIVQQVFLRVHQALPTLRDADKLHAWVYQTARRAIVDHYRAPGYRREVAAGAAIDVVPEAPVADDRDESALRELAACLKPLIRQLAEPDREALRLVEFDGLTQVAAARRLGLSVSGMKSRVQRARAHLRSALDDCCRVALDPRGGIIDYEGRGGRCGPKDSQAGCGCASASTPAVVSD
jgi:RNA polymerase sigma-70 factor (ECF subfamily)